MEKIWMTATIKLYFHKNARVTIIIQNYNMHWGNFFCIMSTFKMLDLFDNDC